MRRLAFAGLVALALHGLVLGLLWVAPRVEARIANVSESFLTVFDPPERPRPPLANASPVDDGRPAPRRAAVPPRRGAAAPPLTASEPTGMEGGIETVSPTAALVSPTPEASPGPSPGPLAAAPPAEPATRVPVPAPDPALVARRCSRQIEAALRYPLFARRLGLTGTARIRFLVDAAGRPLQPTLVRSSGHAVLDAEALAALDRAAPFPAFDRPIEVPVIFTLTR